MKIAVYHYRNKVLARRYNTEKVNNAADEARRRDAVLLCISPLMNISDLIGIYQLNRIKAIVRSYAGRIPSNAIESLVKIAEEHAIYIMVGGILERAGPKLFMTSLLITPDGRIKGKVRKVTISKEEAALGLSPGRVQNSDLTVQKHGVGVLMDTDLLAPEYAKLQKAWGAEFFVAFFKRRLRRGDSHLLVRSLALARAIETSSPVILCGGIVEHHGEIFYTTPSLIVSPTGIKKEAINEEKIIYWDLNDLYSDVDVVNLSSVSNNVLAEAYRELAKIMKYGR